MSAKHGTKRQRKLIGEYVRWMANELELRDWTIHISGKEPDDPDRQFACVDIAYGRKHATIAFRADFWTASRKRQRQTICHELIHAHFKAAEWNLNNVGDHVGQALFDVLFKGHRDAIEFGVDAMADAVAKHLPIPKKVKASA